MRFAIFSDIHGNLAALRAVTAAVESSGPFERVIVAGDLAQGGPRPRECWEHLRDRGWTLVRGNEDESLGLSRVAHGEFPPHLRAAALAQIRWTREQLTAEILSGLMMLPRQYRQETPAGDLIVVHSSPCGTNDRRGGPHNTAAEVRDAYGRTGATAIAFGHYHNCFVRTTEFALLVNVASVGLPLSGRPLASYTILTATLGGWIVQQRQAPYDAREEIEAAREREMPEWVIADAPLG